MNYSPNIQISETLRKYIDEEVAKFKRDLIVSLHGELDTLLKDEAKQELKDSPVLKTAIVNTPIAELVENHRQDFTFIINGQSLEISQRNVKPLVREIFSRSDFEVLSNPIIFGILADEGYIDKSRAETEKKYRGKWVSAISLSLGNLKEYKKIEEVETIDKSGRSKGYRNRVKHIVPA